MAAEGGGAGDMSDEKFDEVFAGLKRWSEKERTEYCEGVGDHPLFLDHSPSQKETDGSSYLSALQNLEYDEHDTPVSLATEAKEKGNASFAKGSVFYGHAIKHYNDCIDHASKGIKREADSKKDRDAAEVLLSTAYANLAAIYLARRKFITALDCCEKSLQHQPRNVKALYRAAKACLEVGRADAAVAFCSSGIAAAKAAAAAAAPAADAAAAGAGAGGAGAAAAAEPKEVAGFRELAKAAAAAVARQAAVRRDVERSRRAQLAEITTARAAVRERGIAVGPPLYRRLAMHIAGPGISPLPKPDPEQPSCLMWPVLVLYPEHHTADFVTACAEVSFSALPRCCHTIATRAPAATLHARSCCIALNLTCIITAAIALLLLEHTLASPCRLRPSAICSHRCCPCRRQGRTPGRRTACPGTAQAPTGWGAWTASTSPARAPRCPRAAPGATSRMTSRRPWQPLSEGRRSGRQHVQAMTLQRAAQALDLQQMLQMPSRTSTQAHWQVQVLRAQAAPRRSQGRASWCGCRTPRPCCWRWCSAATCSATCPSSTCCPGTPRMRRDESLQGGRAGHSRPWRCRQSSQPLWRRAPPVELSNCTAAFLNAMRSPVRFSPHRSHKRSCSAYQRHVARYREL